MTVQRFIKQVFTIAIAFLVSFFFLCVVGIFLFTKITSTNSRKIKDHTVLSFTMGGRVIESMPVSLLGSNKGMINFKAVTQAIRQATQDGRIRAIYLDLSYLNAGWPVLEEIRADLLAFKKAGKTIVAYADYYTQRSYYLAALADKIVLNPSGFLEFKGLSATVTFYTKALQNLSIKPVIFRLGAFKSAVEPYSLTKMSKESRQQTSDCVYSIYNHFLNKIGEARGISPDVLKEHANNLSAVAPSDALDANLITTIGYATDAKTFLKEKNKDGSFVNYAHYNASLTPPDLANKIAVLTAEGTIIDGQGSAGYVGSKDFVKTLKAAQKDSDIKAVVLRINSPGGSVIASDVIWKAVEALKSVKPVVVSMSNVAASGGYYIAAPSNYIFAQPTTITGSIGVFGLLFDPSELVHKIGIDHDVVKTAPSADFLEGFPFPRVTCSELESKFMYKMLQQSYDAFLAKVAAGRGLDVTCVEKLAGGRIYTGAVAKQNGLVDELGGLEEAIAKAASLANLNAKYAIAYLPRPKTKLEQLLSYTTDTIKTELLDSFVQAYPVLNHYQMLSGPYSLQAMLPYTMHID